MNQNQIPLPDGLDFYSFIKKEGPKEEYGFVTTYNVEYTIKFKSSAYIFGEDKPYAPLLYEFSILAQFSGPESYVRDDRISATVVAIFIDFYNRKSENISFYICDSSDSRQHVRKRKFDSWFSEYNKGAFIKFDGEIQDRDGVRYPVAIIMRHNNPFKNELAVDFVNLLAGINDGK
jgi:Family of unknown function (DUF6169)